MNLGLLPEGKGKVPTFGKITGCILALASGKFVDVGLYSVTGDRAGLCARFYRGV